MKSNFRIWACATLERTVRLIGRLVDCRQRVALRHVTLVANEFSTPLVCCLEDGDMRWWWRRQLPISSTLRSDITRWAARYDPLLRRHSVANQCFVNQRAARAFEHQARQLGGRLATELGERFLVEIRGFHWNRRKLIPLNNLRSMASDLGLLAYDCNTAIYFIGRPGGRGEGEELQIALDSIYRFYRCGLICSPCGREEKVEPTRNQWEEYIRLLSGTDPYDGNLDSYVIWNRWDFCATPFTHGLIELYKLNDKQEFKEREFAEAMEELFEKNGVAWSEQPLVRSSWNSRAKR